MLDFRHETFLALCKIRHYTRTAQALHITQPAVTQHIQFLEDYYGGKLFSYKNRRLSLTSRGEKLLKFALTMRSDSALLQETLRQEEERSVRLRFGATLSIGEFVMPELLEQLLLDYPHIHVNMPVNNTQVLLQKLRDGEIDFALLEGYFDRSEYSSELFSTEEFIGVCGGEHHLRGKEVSLSEVLDERIILREPGSGTREIFEHMLGEHNLSTGSIKSWCEVGNMGTIKRLVAGNCGITFLYRAAAARELESGDLMEINLKEKLSHDFSFVCLKDSLYQPDYKVWLEYFKRERK